MLRVEFIQHINKLKRLWSSNKIAIQQENAIITRNTVSDIKLNRQINSPMDNLKTRNKTNIFRTRTNILTNLFKEKTLNIQEKTFNDNSPINPGILPDNLSTIEQPSITDNKHLNNRNLLGYTNNPNEIIS